MRDMAGMMMHHRTTAQNFSISPGKPLLGTLASGKDADAVLLLLSPSECFEQGKVMLDKPLFPLLIRGRNDEVMALNAFEPGMAESCR